MASRSFPFFEEAVGRGYEIAATNLTFVILKVIHG